MALDLPPNLANNGAPAPEKQPAEQQGQDLTAEFQALKEQQAKQDELITTLKNELTGKGEMLTRRTAKSKEFDGFLGRHGFDSIDALEKHLESQMSDAEKKNLEQMQLKQRLETAESQLGAIQKEREQKRYNAEIFRVVDAIGPVEDRRQDTFNQVAPMFQKGEDGIATWIGKVEMSKFITEFKERNLTWLPGQAPAGGGTDLDKAGLGKPPVMPTKGRDDMTDQEKSAYVAAHGLEKFKALPR